MLKSILITSQWRNKEEESITDFVILFINSHSNLGTFGDKKSTVSKSIYKSIFSYPRIKISWRNKSMSLMCRITLTSSPQADSSFYSPLI